MFETIILHTLIIVGMILVIAITAAIVVAIVAFICVLWDFIDKR